MKQYIIIYEDKIVEQFDNISSVSLYLSYLNDEERKKYNVYKFYYNGYYN
jgi:hypothetical protein